MSRFSFLPSANKAPKSAAGNGKLTQPEVIERAAAYLIPQWVTNQKPVSKTELREAAFADYYAKNNVLGTCLGDGINGEGGAGLYTKSVKGEACYVATQQNVANFANHPDIDFDSVLREIGWTVEEFEQHVLTLPV